MPRPTVADAPAFVDTNLPQRCSVAAGRLLTITWFRPFLSAARTPLAAAARKGFDAKRYSRRVSCGARAGGTLGGIASIRPGSHPGRSRTFANQPSGGALRHAQAVETPTRAPPSPKRTTGI